MNATLQGLISNAERAWSERQHDGKTHVTVVVDTSSLARGARETLAALQSAAANPANDMVVHITGSWGFCWMEPCVMVRSAAGTRSVLYHDITADLVPELVERCVTNGSDWPEMALGIVDGTATAYIRLLSDHN